MGLGNSDSSSRISRLFRLFLDTTIAPNSSLLPTKCSAGTSSVFVSKRQSQSMRDFPTSLPRGTQNLTFWGQAYQPQMVLHVAMSHLGASKCLCCTGESAAFTSHTSWFLGSENRYAGNSLGHSPHLQITATQVESRNPSTFQVSIFRPDIGLWPLASQRTEGPLGISPPAQPPSRAPKNCSNASGGLGYGDLRSSPWSLTQKKIF